jgi:hypothetical protein
VTELKPGAQLASVVCDTRVIVVKADDGVTDLTCGGRPMVPADRAPEPTGPVPDELTGPSVIGRRYVDEADSLEVLCTKAGAGMLAAGGIPLQVKAPKPLPSSD